jgi:catechol 2,3-dioxygenase-like lactoylglutathione lyase family enzyme
VRKLAAGTYSRVGDLQRSLRFYRDGLGFEVVFQAEEDGSPFFARLERDGILLLLSDRPARFVEDGSEAAEHEHDEHGRHPFHGANSVRFGELNSVTYLYVDDAEASLALLRAGGIEPVQPPEDMAYGAREFLVRDPDGYYITFSQRLG